MTMVVVEQNARIALSISDYGYIMENGRLVLEGAGKELLENEDIKEFYLGLESQGQTEELPGGQALQTQKTMAGLGGGIRLPA